MTNRFGDPRVALGLITEEELQVETAPEEDFIAGYMEGFENPGRIVPKESSWAWCGHWHGQIDGMAAALAEAQDDKITLLHPEEQFRVFIAENESEAV